MKSPFSSASPRLIRIIRSVLSFQVRVPLSRRFLQQSFIKPVKKSEIPALSNLDYLIRFEKRLRLLELRVGFIEDGGLMVRIQKYSDEVAA